MAPGRLGSWASQIVSDQLGTSVIVLPQRPPLLVAKQWATLDALSGGRMILGVGAGWMREEFEALGTPPYDERGAVTDEYLTAWRALWEDVKENVRPEVWERLEALR